MHYMLYRHMNNPWKRQAERTKRRFSGTESAFLPDISIPVGTPWFLSLSPGLGYLPGSSPPKLGRTWTRSPPPDPSPRHVAPYRLAVCSPAGVTPLS